MRKYPAHIVWLISSLALSLSLAFVIFSSPVPASAASISLTSSVQTNFPASITFNVSAQSSANVTQLRLHYIVDRQNYAKVVSEGWALFNPAPSVKTQWVWDMRKSSIPPGTNVEYWWSASDASGNSVDGDHATMVFDDTRYKWQSITQEPVEILWYNGTKSFADALMTAAQQGLQRIENDTAAIPQGQAKIYIYASAQDLRGSLVFPNEWEGGVSFSGFGIIAIGVPTNQLAFGQRAVPHELTHWAVDQITFNDYGAGLPTWLEEGLATYGEGTLSPDYQSALNAAIKNGQLLSVRTLSSPFSAIPSVALTSYGESNSIVTFLIQQYGKDKMRQLLNVFHEGSGYDAALQSVYGFDQDGLDNLWRQSLQ